MTSKNKGNLVLKPVTDKNGVTTSRWVKPERTNTTSGSIPSVKLDKPVVTNSELLCKKLSDDFGTLDSSSFHVRRIQSALKHYDMGTLKLISEDIAKDPEERLGRAAQWITQYSEEVTYLRELFTYCDAFDPSTDYSFVEDAIGGMKHYRSMPLMQDYSEADPELQQTLRNVLNVTETLLAEDHAQQKGSFPVAMPENMYVLVAQRPEDLDRINDIILDHGVGDGEQIALMLDSSTPQLIDGIL
jgi:hypothetical protein